MSDDTGVLQENKWEPFNKKRKVIWIHKATANEEGKRVASATRDEAVSCLDEKSRHEAPRIWPGLSSFLPALRDSLRDCTYIGRRSKAVHGWLKTHTVLSRMKNAVSCCTPHKLVTKTTYRIPFVRFPI
jgi:hypothetical protein